MKIFESVKNIFSKAPQSKENLSPPPQMGELATSHSILESAGFLDDLRPFNPDLLIRRKGIGVYKDMENDEQIKGSLLIKKYAIVAPGWKIDPASEKKKDVKVAKFCTDVFEAIPGALTDSLLEIMSAFTYGYSVTEIVWKEIEKGKHKGKFGIQDLKGKDPAYYEFDIDGFANLRPNGLVLTGLTTGDKKLPINKFIIFSYRKEFGNFYGRSDLREAYRAWWSKSFTQKAMNIWLERYASPLAVGKYRGNDANKRQKLEDVLNTLSTATSVTLPKDSFEIEFIESKSKGEARYLDVINYHNVAIARAVLIPDRLVAAGEKGAFAQAKIHFDMFVLNIQALRKTIEELVNDQLIRRLVSLNFSKIEEFPKFKFNPITDAEKRAFAVAVIEAVSKGAITKTLDAENFLRETMGMQDITEQDMEPVEAEEPKNSTDSEETTTDNSKTALLEETREKYIERLNKILDKQQISVVDYLYKKSAENQITDKFIQDGFSLRYVNEFKSVVKDGLIETYSLNEENKELPQNYLNSKVNFFSDQILPNITKNIKDALLEIRDGGDIDGTVGDIYKAYTEQIVNILVRIHFVDY